MVVGENREEIGLLLVPHDHQRAHLSSDALRAPLAEEVMRGLAILNAAAEGSSRRVARALLLREPLSLDAGEITDKGSLNVRAILRLRTAELERLYSGGPDVMVAS